MSNQKGSIKKKNFLNCDMSLGKKSYMVVVIY